MKAVASIIITTFQHAAYLPDAIDSALAQTVPCDVIVIDDGSTDDTLEILEPYARHSVRCIFFPANRGVSKARNAGIGAAIGDFLMFLDADDIIEPHKVETQAFELLDSPGAGWCLSDVRIIDDVSGKDEPASKRYGYAEMDLSGFIGPLLAERNFIPVHSPLIRRSVLGNIRFGDGNLEDWKFWQALAAVSPCVFVPEVLATYRARRNGRNRKSK